MLILRAYFDETGHGEDANTKFLGIAGCLTRIEVWEKLEKKWSATLESEGLRYFHMREFAFSVGEFKTWKGDEGRRQRIYGTLWNIILDGKLIPVGGFVRLDDYQQELTGREHHVFRDSYFLCHLQCLRFLAQYLEFDSVSNITTFFDNKKGFKGEAFRIHDVLTPRFGRRIPPPTFRNMRKCLPLQVADIVAYESKKNSNVNCSCPKRNQDGDLRSLKS